MTDFKFLGHEQKDRLNFLLMKRWWKCHVSCISRFNIHSSYWPEAHVTREWDKAVLSLFARPSENLIKVLPLRNKKVRGSYSNGNFFKLSCSWVPEWEPTFQEREKEMVLSLFSHSTEQRSLGKRLQPTRYYVKHQTFLIHEWHGWSFRTGSGTRFAYQMQIIKQNNVKPSRTPRDNSVENRFQRFALSFVSFLRRKHDFRRRISTFVWRILFEEPRIWISGLNLRTRVLKSVTAAQERLDMRRGCHAKILPVGVCGTKNVPGA